MISTRSARLKLSETIPAEEPRGGGSSLRSGGPGTSPAGGTGVSAWGAPSGVGAGIDGCDGAAPPCCAACGAGTGTARRIGGFGFFGGRGGGGGAGGGKFMVKK